MTKFVREIRDILGMEEDINLKQVRITPDMASELLKFNTHNRTRQKAREKEYAKDMEEGKFGLQESMITFDENGILTNGQTRLHACVLAKKEFSTTVFIGLEQNLHMDTGKSRNSVDNIQLSGVLHGVIEDNANSIKTVKALLRLSQHQSRVRDEEVIDFCKKYSKYITDADNLGLLNLTGGKKFLFKAEIAASFLAATINGVSLTDLAHIRTILTDGRSVDDRDRVIQNFRDKVLEIGMSSSGTVKKQIYYGTQHVIYCYTNRKKTTTVRTESEYYPII